MQPTEEECLTLQIELPCLYVLQENFRTWQTQLIHSGLGNIPSIVYRNKLFLMENAINHQISKHLQVCTCPKSDSWTQKEYVHLEG